MKRYHHIAARAFAVVIVLVTFPLAASAGPVPQPPLPRDVRIVSSQGAWTGTDFAPGRILVRLKEGATADSARALLDQHGLTVIGQIEQIGVHILAVPEGRELALVEQLRAHPQVVYAEPDYIYWAFAPPNDTYYAEYQWNMRQINAESAWDITTGSSSVTIAIVDSGVDLTHPDLADKIVAGYDFVSDDSVPSDSNGHGTHVAGIAAAVTNNGEGVAGVSWGARIMPVRVLNSMGWGTSSDIASGITWAADHGAQVINLSLGRDSSSSTMEDAVNYAYGQGALLVAAVGNEYEEGNPTEYPAAYDHVLAVAASGDEDEHADYSNTGFYVDVAAPGGNPSGSDDPDPNHWIFSTYWVLIGRLCPGVRFLSSLSPCGWAGRTHPVGEQRPKQRSGGDAYRNYRRRPGESRLGRGVRPRED